MQRISVVITCYSEGILLYNAVNSLHHQSTQNYEIILVNDASPHEKTNEVCHQISQQNKAITYIRNTQNLGLSGARNRGIRQASGQIIVPLDADDVLPFHSLELINKTFEEKPDIDFAFGDYIINYNNYKTIKITDCSQLADTEGKLSPHLLANKWLLLGTSPFKKELWERLNGYDPGFSYSCQDVDFWQRALLMEAKGYYIPDIIYQWNRNNGGMNSNPLREKVFMSVFLKNIDFTLHYKKDYKEPLKMAMKLKDINAIQHWVRHHVKRKNYRLLVVIIWLMPVKWIAYISKWIYS
jgi:glycosyltransferase involved in cell wall biosynthesis